MAPPRRSHEPDPDLRAHAIRLLSRGLSQAEVARQVGVSREAVRQWVALYMQGGIAALAPRPRGKRSRVKADAAAPLFEKMNENPGAFGLERRWGIQDARRVIDEELGVRLSPQRIHALLLKLGYRFVAGVGWRQQVREKHPPVAPWGFRRDRDGRLVPDPEERRITAIVRLAYVQGLTLPEIVAMLRKKKKTGRTGKPIGTTRVFEMIHGKPPRRRTRESEPPGVPRSATRLRARSLAAVVSRHVETALERASFLRLEDGSYGAMVPGLRGILATGADVEECRASLARVVEGWRKLADGLERRHHARGVDAGGLRAQEPEGSA
jgi:transposase/predicted RNase H-like HicB family nuclease